MTYTTAKCKNCGYKIRNNESNLPRVQLGMPIMVCPKCGSLILDTIATEYEFMSERERENFSNQKALSKTYLGNIIFIGFGIFMLIGGFTNNITALILIGLALLGMGIYQIIKNRLLIANNSIELMIYYSLKRTSNNDYIKILNRAYSSNNMSRKYNPYERKETFLEEHKFLENKSSYSDETEFVEEICNRTSADTAIYKSQVTTFNQY